MRTLSLIAGIVLFVAIAVDLVWTTIGTHGGGPLSKHLARAVWNMAHAIHRRRHIHYLLSFVGAIILLGTIIFWVVGTWAAWVLIFGYAGNSLLDAHTHTPAPLTGRIFFVAYALSSMGNGDYQPGAAAWRIVASFTTLSGISALTLAVSFVMSVLSAVVEKRALGALISDLGGSPHRILERGWNGTRFEGLDQHLIQLTGMIHLFTQQHLAYPVLHYFHSEESRNSAQLRLAGLFDTVLLLKEGVVPDLRLPEIVTAPLVDAFSALARVFSTEFLPASGETPPALTLVALRECGVPTVPDAEFAGRVETVAFVRRTLDGLLDDDGWNWEESMEPPPRPIN